MYHAVFRIDSYTFNDVLDDSLFSQIKSWGKEFASLLINIFNLIPAIIFQWQIRSKNDCHSHKFKCNILFLPLRH